MVKASMGMGKSYQLAEYIKRGFAGGKINSVLVITARQQQTFSSIGDLTRRVPGIKFENYLDQVGKDLRSLPFLAIQYESLHRLLTRDVEDDTLVRDSTYHFIYKYCSSYLNITCTNMSI